MPNVRSARRSVAAATGLRFARARPRRRVRDFPRFRDPFLLAGFARRRPPFFDLRFELELERAARRGFFRRDVARELELEAEIRFTTTARRRLVAIAMATRRT